jgi:hypothetical protein
MRAGGPTGLAAVRRRHRLNSRRNGICAAMFSHTAKFWRLSAVSTLFLISSACIGRMPAPLKDRSVPSTATVAYAGVAATIHQEPIRHGCEVGKREWSDGLLPRRVCYGNTVAYESMSDRCANRCRSAEVSASRRSLKASSRHRLQHSPRSLREITDGRTARRGARPLAHGTE